VVAYDELINELSYICGIVPEYWDIFGGRHETSVETKKAILASMGVKTGTSAELSNELEKRRLRPWNVFIDPAFVILHSEQPILITVHVPVRKGDESSISFRCALEDENENIDAFSFALQDIEIVERRVIDGINHLKINITLDTLKAIGYYTFDILYTSSGFGLSASSRIIITPETCYLPPAFEAANADAIETESHAEKTRTWGLCLNLYGIRSEKNWGLGDFSDLRRITEWTADLGCGFIGINPLHAIPNNRPYGISPYSPVSRLFKNFIYLEITAVPDVIESSAALELMETDNFIEKIKALRESEFIDYESVATLKKRILRLAFESFFDIHYFKGSPRGEAFKRYIKSEGTLLEDFALFSAIQATLRIESWADWPKEFLDITDPEVETFRKENEKDILFYQYIQWLIDLQHGEIEELSHQLGMPIGLYHDLAVGSSGGGFDSWIARKLMAKGMDVGAPPDDFNPTGQNWGFPPFAPEKMKASGYEFLVQTLRKNMQYAGALRIDHALGMFRLFWIPSGISAEYGAYVIYPSEDILRIIALESVRNKTVVIAEDLGTVGEDVRETLFRFRMLSYKLLYFERNYPDPAFKLPARYTDLALCSVTTHDLPTLYGYWSGRDIEAKTRLGLYPNEGLRQHQIHERQRDKELLLQALTSLDLLPESFSEDPATYAIMIPSLCMTIYEYLSLAPSRLLAVSLDDIIGTLDQQNMPGTVDSYPNWLRKTPGTLEQIMISRSFLALSKIFKRNYR
jgi:4-alpha-glucanotransferase